jgi:hypothetical protein
MLVLFIQPCTILVEWHQRRTQPVYEVNYHRKKTEHQTN